MYCIALHTRSGRIDQACCHNSAFVIEGIIIRQTLETIINAVITKPKLAPGVFQSDFWDRSLFYAKCYE